MPEPGFGEKRNNNEVRLEDIPQYQSCFSREGVKKLSNLEQNRVTILLPDEFYNSTVERCEYLKETRGVLLVAKGNPQYQKGELPVCAIIDQTQKNNNTSTQAYLDIKKAQAMTKLLHDYKDEITMIDYHSHVKATGDFWVNKFSGGDNQSLANAVNRNKGYMHVLFTPENILTFGKGKPQFGVVKFKNFDPLETQAHWQNIFNQYVERQ